MKRAWRGHAGHAGPIDGTELNLRYIESDRRGLETSLHYFQWTSKYSSNRAPTSGMNTEVGKTCQLANNLTFTADGKKLNLNGILQCQKMQRRSEMCKVLIELHK